VDTVHECDGRTDGRTDRITITKTVQRIASHGKQESYAIAKMTAKCALHMGALKIFGTP